MKMSLKLVAAAAAVASAFALSACGDKKEAAPAKPATPAAPAAQSKAAEPLKVGFVYVAPIADVGYTKQHDIGRIYAIDKVGKDKVTTTFVENVPETADAERVIRQMVADGNKLIFGTSFGYMNYMQKLAKEYPDVKFEHATGYKTAPNMTNYNIRFYEGRYLAGMLAGGATKSNIIGYVAPFPIPEVLQGINAFTLGAKSVNPNIQVKVIWTNAWYDPPKDTYSAKTLLGQGADILTQHTQAGALCPHKGFISVGALPAQTVVHMAGRERIAEPRLQLPQQEQQRHAVRPTGDRRRQPQRCTGLQKPLPDAEILHPGKNHSIHQRLKSTSIKRVWAPSQPSGTVLVSP